MGAEACAIRKEAYDMVRLGDIVNGRQVLDPRHDVFRPSNPEYTAIAKMGP
jgi:hypothetical protein